MTGNKSKLTDFLHHIAHQGRRRELEDLACSGNVDIQICDCRTREPGQVFLNPLSAANQAVLLSVPAREDYCPHWLPACLHGSAKASDDLVERCAAAVWVSCASSNPSITVVAKNNDFIGDGAVDDSNDVPQGRRNVVLLVDQVQHEIVWRRPNVVFYALVVQTAAVPVLVEG